MSKLLTVTDGVQTKVHFAGSWEQGDGGAQLTAKHGNGILRVTVSAKKLKMQSLFCASTAPASR